MAMGKSYKVWQKLSPQGPYSVLLEQRNRDESLLFESLVVAALGIYNLNPIFSKYLTQSRFSGPSEVEVIKKQYTKLFDAYGCLGMLQINSGWFSTIQSENIFIKIDL